MPQPRPTSRTTLVRLVFLALLGWALYGLGRGAAEARKTHEPVDFDHTIDDTARAADAAVPAPARKRGRRRRFATSLAFATLFFAGAALSAGAGDALVGAIEQDTTTAATTTEEAPPEEPAEEAIPPAEEPAAEEAPAAIPPEGEAPAAEPPAEAAPAEPAPAPETPAPGSEPAPPAEGAPGTEPAPATPAPGEAGPEPSAGAPAPAETAPAPVIPAGPPVIAPHAHEDEEETHELDPETDTIGTFSTVWLHRALPDPTPPARRLSPAFARTLRAEARRAGVEWSSLLGALRADGKGGRTPATRSYLRWFAGQLGDRMDAGEWQGFLALRGRTAFADRAQALARYNRAVGLRALVIGLDASKETLAESVLADGRLGIYGAGRGDIAAGRIDVRVLVLMRYLAEAHGQATISSLQSGHRLYSRPGVISAHIYGLAVDVAALGGRPIMGNSSPGGLTEEGVRSILLLPAELRPRQVISLLGLGGPSFPLANHADHIHVGF